MTTLTCARCGLHVAHVRDTRFGILPDSILCRACTLPAFHTGARFVRP